MEEKNKQSSKPTMRVSIIVAFIILIVVSFSSITGLIYYYTKHAFREMVEDLMNKVAQRVKVETKNHFEPAVSEILFFTSASEKKIINFNDFDQIESIFLERLKLVDSIEMLNLGLNDGSFIMLKRMPDGSLHTKIVRNGVATWKRRGVKSDVVVSTQTDPKDGYDPRKRPWFIGAKDKKELFWTDVYTFFADKKPGITVSKAFYIENKLAGVMAADIGLEDLSRFISKMKVSRSGEIFILDGNENVTACPEKVSEGKCLLLKPLSEMKASLYKKTEQKIRIINNIDTKPLSFNVGKKEYSLLTLLLPVPEGRNWKVVILVPSSDFLSRLLAITKKALFLIIFLFVGALITGVIVSHQMSKPLKGLVKEVDKIRSFDFSTSTEISQSGFQEIENVLESVENMKMGLRALEKYVPKDLVKILLAQQSDPQLGGSIQDLAIFFSDIEGFTSISEELDPQSLTEFLGDYLDAMSSTIRYHQGTVDKFIGDAVMAFWGAPLNVENPEKCACIAALQCQKGIAELSRKFPDRPPFRTRIGIDSGSVLVGNIGSSTRFNYTVIGDHVNQASRLEGINKIYGTSIIISENVHKKIGTGFITRKLDLVTVKGKSKPVYIFELLGSDDDDEETINNQRLELWNQAFDLYLSGDFKKALSLFNDGKTNWPEDVAFKVFHSRCQLMIDNPPGDEWTGVYAIKTK